MVFMALQSYARGVVAIAARTVDTNIIVALGGLREQGVPTWVKGPPTDTQFDPAFSITWFLFLR